jgi:hypothetical protein
MITTSICAPTCNYYQSSCKRLDSCYEGSRTEILKSTRERSFLRPATLCRENTGIKTFGVLGTGEYQINVLSKCACNLLYA